MKAFELNGETVKTCSSCKRTLPTSMFHFNRSLSDGLQCQCKECKSGKWLNRDREVHRRSTTKRRYGLTLEQYDELLLDQNGACAICREPETLTVGGRLRRLAIDHDHSTDTVRGLLCYGCNVSLGHFNDSVPTLERAIRYLNGDI